MVNQAITTAPDLTDAPEITDVDAAMREAVDACIEKAATWLAWNGQPQVRLGSVWTPHKVLRRVVDHFIDHIAQVEAIVAGVPPPDSKWLGRSVTLDSDWAHFTESDLREATARIRRLGDAYVWRLRSLAQGEYEQRTPGSWSIKEITEHLTDGIREYCEQLK
jgi:hypothetical protein